MNLDFYSGKRQKFEFVVKDKYFRNVIAQVQNDPGKFFKDGGRFEMAPYFEHEFKIVNGGRVAQIIVIKVREVRYHGFEIIGEDEVRVIGTGIPEKVIQDV